jgi:hypothetical protein
MKVLTLLILNLAALAATTYAQEAIRPVVASEFGKPITIRAEFVAKPNTYYDQNIVSEPYSLKVVEVEGRELKQPVLIEYRFHRFQIGKRERDQIERPGIMQTFEAYESLYQPTMFTPWLPGGVQGGAFVLVHILYVRPSQKKG